VILTHDEKSPVIHPTAYVAPNATVCGDVTVGAGCRIMFGACVISEGQPLVLGEHCIVMENAVIRSTSVHPTRIGAHCLVGPHAHLAGCTLDECVFIATGASVLHGATLGFGAEVRVNGVVHLRTELPPHSTVPLGWVAVGTPARLFPPEQHDAIWAVQRPLDFPRFVYGVDRPPAGESNMKEIARKRSEALGGHRFDRIL